jgi:hypothetical protein
MLPPPLPRPVRAGKDASRAFVTGCFQPHHLTHDLRGLSDDELKVRVDRLLDPSAPPLSSSQLKLTLTVWNHQGLDHWHTFFATSKKYKLVGHVRLPAIDPSTPPPGPCSSGEAGAGAPGGEGQGRKPVVNGAAAPRGDGRPRAEL